MTGYQWAFRYRDVIVPCRDEEAARAEVARFPTDRVLVRRPAGPWEAVPPAGDDADGEPRA